MFEGFRNRVKGNTSSGNLRGIRLSVGSANNQFRSNVVENNREYGLYFYTGSDATTGGAFVAPKDNKFYLDRVAGSGSHSIKITNGDRNVFDTTTFSSNARPPIFCGTGNKLVNPKPSTTKAAPCSSTTTLRTAQSAPVQPRERPILDKG